MRDLARGLFAVTSIAFAVSCMAADATETKDKSNSTESAGTTQLEQVVVQARRREERLSDVPASVSAMSAAALKTAGVSSVTGLSQYVPGLNVAEGVDNSTARFFIRGMGTVTPTVGVEPSVPVYIDDVYTPSGLGSNINLFSVDRVEVLRGPQGTLYGRNAFGGAVKVYTKDLTDKSEGYVELATGNNNRKDMKAEVSGALVPGMLRFNLGAASLTRDGYQTFVNIDKKGWGENTQVFKGKLQLDPTENLRFTVGYDKTDADAPAKQFKITNIGNDFFNYNVLHEKYDRVVRVRLQTSTDPDVVDTDTYGNSTVNAEGLTWSARWQAGEDLTIKYLGADRKLKNGRFYDVDGTAAAFCTVTEEFNLGGQSHELQANWTKGDLNFVGGVFYYKEDTTSRSAEVNGWLNGEDSKSKANYVTDPNGEITGVDIRRVWDGLSQQVTSRAIFMNVGYAVNKDLNVTGGVRYTEDNKATQGDRPGTVFYGGSLANLSTNGSFAVPQGATIINPALGGGLSGERTYQSTTPELTVDYSFSRNQMVYGSYKRGFQAGTIFPSANKVPGAALSTDAQVVDAYELGSKGTYMDGRLSLNASVYYNRYKDLLVSVQTPVDTLVSGTGFAGRPQNAGAAHSKGIELESRFQATRQLLLTANVALNQFSVTEVMDAKKGNIANTYLDVPTLAPKVQANLRLDYRFGVSQGLTAKVFANAAYRSDMGTNAQSGTDGGLGVGLVTSVLANDKYYISNAVTLLSAGVSLTTEDLKWRVDLIGQNLTDQRRPVSTVAVSPDNLGAIQQWNEPRSWRLSLTRSF